MPWIRSVSPWHVPCLGYVPYPRRDWAYVRTFRLRSRRYDTLCRSWTSPDGKIRSAVLVNALRCDSLRRRRSTGSRSFGTMRSAAWTREVLQTGVPGPLPQARCPPVVDGTMYSAASVVRSSPKRPKLAICRRRPALSPGSHALRSCRGSPRVLFRRLSCLSALGRRPRFRRQGRPVARNGWGSS